MCNTPLEQSAGTARTEADIRLELCQEITREIERLKRFSHRGLLALSLFLVVCMTAWNGFALLPVPDTVIASLGKPPSPQAISIALLVYTFSAIILSLGRMTTGIEHRSSFCHVCYLSVFFLFYHYSRALNDNYWAVFGAGVTILGIESYRIWSYCNENIAKKHEQLAFVEKNGRMPPDE